MDANKEAMNSEAVTEPGIQEQPAAEETAAEKGEGQKDEKAVRQEPEREKAGLSGREGKDSAASPRVSSGRKRILVGRVISDRMQKTIVVQIESRKLHPLYKKYITRTKKIKAHDENNQCGVGDLVRVVESRPISKDKCWRLVEILEKAK